MGKLLAYYDPNRNIQSSLEDHSRHVAEFLATVFKDRLASNNPVFKLLDRALNQDNLVYKTTILASYLHDIGKASRYYQLTLEKRSFKYHEHLSALVLSSTWSHLIDQNHLLCALIFYMASAIVSRHHVAMTHRHPDRIIKLLGNNPEAAKQLIEAAKNIEPNDVNQILKPLPLPIRDAIINGINELKSSLAKHNPVILVSEKLTPTTTNGIVKNLPNFIRNVQGDQGSTSMDAAKLLKIIQIASGALIVSDILVAWRERGDADPQSAYARSWLVELDAAAALDSIVNDTTTYRFTQELDRLSTICRM